ncbi:MAG: RIP metalloprotease RseP, partial [Gammaproteobacteria bacterium]
MSFLISAAAFIVAIGTLVTFHEFGHYWVARKLGVKVLRFSVGFGRPLWKKIAGADQTEYVIAAIPLGGYVKMLDEREGDVDEADLPRAFNRQGVWSRIAIVAAGPAANFLLAIIAYWIMFMAGVSGVKPVVGEIAPDSIAARGGLVSGDQILAVNGRATPTWQITGITLIDEALERGRVELKVDGQTSGTRFLTLDLSDTAQLLGEGNLLDKIGISPWRLKLDPVLGELTPGDPAERDGLHTGDRILTADGERMESWADWVEHVQGRPGQAITVRADRNGQTVEITVTPKAKREDGATIGRIGALPHVDEAQFDAMRVMVRYGPLASLGRAVVKTWD